MSSFLGMDESLLIKAQKRKTESGLDLYIICLSKKTERKCNKGAKILSNSIKNLLPILHERHIYGNPAVAEFVSRTKHCTDYEQEKGVSQIHRTCCRDLTTKVKKESKT